MASKKPSQWIAIIGLLAFLVSLLGIYAGDATLRGGKPLWIETSEGDRLQATYYSGRLQAGVLLFSGFGSDQVTMRAAASEFHRRGVHVFTVDFSGHGRSPGGLTFDNAATDRLAGQALAAFASFQQQSGLAADQIIFLGHSLGARVALQSAGMTGEPPQGIVLLGPQVNLITNEQAEFFTGTQDMDLAWVQQLSANTPASHVLMITGTWDDIITPQAGLTLLQKLTGDGVLVPQNRLSIEELRSRYSWLPADLLAEGKAVPFVRYGSFDETSSREWILIPRLAHNYEVFSGRALSRAVAWSTELWKLQPAMNPWAAAADRRIILWVAGFGGLLAALGGGFAWVSRKFPIFLQPQGLAIRKMSRFLWGKLALWLAALPFVGLIFGLAMLAPLPAPVFNLIYVGFIGGYGVLLLLLARLGRLPGVQGKLAWRNQSIQVDLWRWLLAIGFNLILVLLMFAYARSGWLYAPPVGDRLIWVLLFTPLTMLGFWMGQLEGDWIREAAPGQAGPVWAATLIGLVPFFLWTAVLAVLGSTSGMLGGLQGLLLLAVVLLQGTITRILCGQRWLAALLQSLLLYSLLIPQGVLFLI